MYCKHVLLFAYLPAFLFYSTMCTFFSTSAKSHIFPCLRTYTTIFFCEIEGYRHPTKIEYGFFFHLQGYTSLVCIIIVTCVFTVLGKMGCLIEAGCLSILPALHVSFCPRSAVVCSLLMTICYSCECTFSILDKVHEKCIFMLKFCIKKFSIAKVH